MGPSTSISIRLKHLLAVLLRGPGVYLTYIVLLVCTLGSTTWIHLRSVEHHRISAERRQHFSDLQMLLHETETLLTEFKMLSSVRPASPNDHSIRARSEDLHAKLMEQHRRTLDLVNSLDGTLVTPVLTDSILTTLKDLASTPLQSLDRSMGNWVKQQDTSGSDSTLFTHAQASSEILRIHQAIVELQGKTDSEERSQQREHSYLLICMHLLVALLVGILAHLGRRMAHSIDILHGEAMRYRAALDHAAMVSRLDTSGTISGVNDRFCQLSGYQRQELIGRPYDTFMNEQHHPEDFFSMLLETIHAGEIWHGEMLGLDKNGRDLWLDATLIPEYDAHKRLQAIHVIAIDITKRKMEEQQKVRLVEESSRLKSQFLANMSHEIRTPINGVLGFTRLLAETRLDREQSDFVQNLQHCGESLLGLVTDILDFSKIEAGKMTLENQPFALMAIVESAVAVVGARAIEKHLPIRVDAKTDLPAWIQGDSHRIRQILINLLSNAVKFTERGTISLVIDGQALADGDFKLSFAVSDTGIGIHAEQQATLFTPFTQADASTTRRFGGSGLGLAICQNLAHLMGGSIEVTSEPGRGSIFTFLLRTRACQPQPSLTPLAPKPCESLHLRILVAEDNPINQRITQVFLKKLGLQCQMVDNGRQAIQALSEQSFDMVLMDLHMPEMDGLEATRLIRKTYGSKSPPIIALTAAASWEDKKACEEAGMDDFLTKPVQLSGLLATIRRQFPESTHSDRLST
jgi:PAS domain S-box-containing protein